MSTGTETGWHAFHLAKIGHPDRIEIRLSDITAFQWDEISRATRIYTGSGGVWLVKEDIPKMIKLLLGASDDD